MNKIKRLGQCMGIFAINLAFIAPAHSNLASVRIPTSSNRTCQQSIDFVRRELVSKGAFVPFHPRGTSRERIEPRVSVQNGNFAREYHSYPRNRPHKAEFVLSGDENRILNVMASPQFLTILASQIMASCPQVGMVNYQHWWKDNIPVGYFPDGTARTFTWVDVDDPRLGGWDNRGRQLPSQWGYYFVP